MKIAVVILNWNGRKLLEQFLPSVTSFSAGANVYVADNASTDDSVAFVRREFPKVKIIQNTVNGGYAKGYNDALKDLQEDILVLLNSDVEVTPNWLEPIRAIFENEAETAALQPKILDFYNRNRFEYAGAAGGFIDKYGYPFCRGRIFEALEEDKNQYDDNAEVFWASGACLAVRRNLFWEAGALDEDFFAHQEEIDLCWRLHNLGYKVKACGASAIYHMGGATLDNMNPRKTYFNFRNGLYLLLKNVPSSKLFSVLLTRMLLDGVAGLKFLAEGKFSHFLAILHAHGSFYRNFSKIRKKRKKLPKLKNYFYLHSIVYAYFFRKERKFGSLKK